MTTKSTSSSSASKSASHVEPPITQGGAPPRKPTRTLKGHVAPGDDPGRKNFVAQYEAAIKHFHAGKFDKAHEHFTKMLPDAPPDIAPAIRSHLRVCQDQMTKSPAKFNTAEDRYDYAISLLNHGHYEDAREHFEAILKSAPQADYPFYGMALLAAMTCDSPRCIEHLAEAIRRNPQNRLLARNDSDFESVADDPSFTELLYPEP